MIPKRDPLTLGEDDLYVLNLAQQNVALIRERRQATLNQVTLANEQARRLQEEADAMGKQAGAVRTMAVKRLKDRLGLELADNQELELTTNTEGFVVGAELITRKAKPEPKRQARKASRPPEPRRAGAPLVELPEGVDPQDAFKTDEPPRSPESAAGASAVDQVDDSKDEGEKPVAGL